MSEVSDEILKRGAADSDITAFRDECFSAWTTYRDAMEDAGEWADITDYRTGFFVGVCAGLNAHATLTEQLAEANDLLIRIQDIHCGGADDPTILEDVDALRRKITRTLNGTDTAEEIQF